MAQQTFSGVPGDFTAGQVLTAADMDKLREFLLYLIKDGDETDTGEVSPLILDLNDDRVGINTDAPGSQLQVSDAAALSRITVAGAGTGYTHSDIRLDATSAGRGLGVYMYNSGDDSTWYMGVPYGVTDQWMVGRYAHADFNNVAADDGYAYLIITEAGRVGINRGAPVAKLHVVASDGWDSADYALRVDNLETTAAQGHGIQVQAGSGAGSSYPLFLWNNSSGACFYVRDDAVAHFYGTVSKAGGSFDIPHPTKGGDWRLRHSFIEGPQADNLYRGTVTLTGGTATVDLDAVSNMTDGTWEALNRDPWALVASSGNAVEWSLAGKTLTITSDTADAVCSWMVIGERQDDFMKSSQGVYADDDGHLIVEYEEAQPVPPPPPDTEDTADAGPPLDG